jgi:hypothetical protein
VAPSSAAGAEIKLPGALRPVAKRYARAISAVFSHPVHCAEFKAEAVERVRSENRLRSLMKDMDFKLSNGSLMLLPEYGFKLKVLKDLQFVTPDEVRRRSSLLRSRCRLVVALVWDLCGLVAVLISFFSAIIVLSAVDFLIGCLHHWAIYFLARAHR